MRKSKLLLVILIIDFSFVVDFFFFSLEIFPWTCSGQCSRLRMKRILWSQAFHSLSKGFKGELLPNDLKYMYILFIRNFVLPRMNNSEINKIFWLSTFSTLSWERRIFSWRKMLILPVLIVHDSNISVTHIFQVSSFSISRFRVTKLFAFGCCGIERRKVRRKKNNFYEILAIYKISSNKVTQLFLRNEAWRVHVAPFIYTWWTFSWPRWRRWLSDTKAPQIFRSQIAPSKKVEKNAIFCFCFAILSDSKNRKHNQLFFQVLRLCFLISYSDTDQIYMKFSNFHYVFIIHRHIFPALRFHRLFRSRHADSAAQGKVCWYNEHNILQVFKSWTRGHFIPGEFKFSNDEGGRYYLFCTFPRWLLFLACGRRWWLRENFMFSFFMKTFLFAFQAFKRKQQRPQPSNFESTLNNSEALPVASFSFSLINPLAFFSFATNWVLETHSDDWTTFDFRLDSSGDPKKLRGIFHCWPETDFLFSFHCFAFYCWWIWNDR